MISQSEERTLKETKIIETKANLLAFKIMYFIVFGISVSSNIIIISMLLAIVPYLEFPIFYSVLINSPLRFLYISIFIVAFLKLNIDGYELVRFIMFLASKDNSKESALQRSGNFIGTKIIRIFSIIFTMVLLLFLEMFVISAYFAIGIQPGASEFMTFYNISAPIVYTQVFIVATAPHILAFSIDPKEKKYIGKFIGYSLTWIFVFILIFIAKFSILAYALGLF
ncbi:MAG: hypothetical protein ACFFBP_00285 [Promethearchaeota archaeon]